MDVFLWVALALLVLGVVGSVLPLLPGALLSVVGVVVYWVSTGFSEPGPIAFVGLTLVGLVALVTDYAGGMVAARFGGASTRTSIVAGVVGFLLMFLIGPLGIFVGVAGTVFALEYVDHQDAEESAGRFSGSHRLTARLAAESAPSPRRRRPARARRRRPPEAA